jgi:adenylate kinase family enzyme
MRRVSIQGISGSGKTTLGAALAQRLGVPHLETDGLVHQAGWRELPDAELRAAVEPVIAGEGWVVDSDYRRKLGTLILERADTLVWLDLPLRVCVRRLVRRSVGRIIRGEELWNGNTESWRGAFVGWDSLLVYALRKHARKERAMRELLARPELAHLRLVRLRTPSAVRAWLASVR